MYASVVWRCRVVFPPAGISLRWAWMMLLSPSWNHRPLLLRQGRWMRSIVRRSPGLTMPEIGGFSRRNSSRAAISDWFLLRSSVAITWKSHSPIRNHPFCLLESGHPSIHRHEGLTIDIGRSRPDQPELLALEAPPRASRGGPEVRVGPVSLLVAQDRPARSAALDVLEQPRRVRGLGRHGVLDLPPEPPQRDRPSALAEVVEKPQEGDLLVEMVAERVPVVEDVAVVAARGGELPRARIRIYDDELVATAGEPSGAL